jgi:hypothetical protein
MSDPITAAAIGAGISGGTSLLRGKSLGSSLQNAAIGGALGGAGGYLGGAMGGAGGTVGSTTGGATGNVGNALATEGAANMGNIGMFNTFNTGAPNLLGQAGTYAQGLNPSLYTGSQGMFDVAKNSTLGYNPSFLGGQGTATFAGGGGYDPSFLGRLQEMGSGAYNKVTGGFSDLTTRDKLGLGMSGIDLLNQSQSQAPLQPSPMLNAQQLMGQQGATPVPQFNSMAQLPRKPIYIG